MAFKSAAADTIGGELPNRMLRDLTRRRIPDTTPPLVSRPCPGCFQRSPGRQSPTLQGYRIPEPDRALHAVTLGQPVTRRYQDPERQPRARPRPFIMYVVTYELCHIQHRDHEARFFKLLGQMMPDCEQRKPQLEAALL